MKTRYLNYVTMLVFFCLPLKHFGQTVSNKENPDWTKTADWTLGIPLNGGETTQNVELNHSSNINYDIKIHNTVTINAGKKLTTSGKIEITKGGKLIVYGQVIILDESLHLKNDGTLTIKDGGYFEGGGKGEFKLDGNGFHLEKGGMMKWDSKMAIDDKNALVIIDGILVAKELKNEGTINGNGSIEVTNKLDNKGTTFDCTNVNCCASYPCLLGTSQIDSEPPVFMSCPANILEMVLAGANTRVVNWILPVVQDNVRVTSLTSNYGLLHAFPIGTTTVIYVAKDAAGNSSSCSFDVTIMDIVEINDPPFLKDYSVNVTDLGLVTLCLEMQDVEDDALIINTIIERPEKADIVSIDPKQLCLDFTTTTGFQHFVIEVCDNGEPRQCVNVELEFELEINIKLRVYKGLSPNGDGNNDLWIIDGIEHFPDNTLKVFDRWGKLVYSVDNYNNEDRVWDGRANVDGGTILPNGSYFYRIDIEGNGVFQGYVELLK